MNLTIQASNASELFIESLTKIRACGSKVDVRGLHTEELLFPTLILTNPRARWLQIPERKMNTFASCVETLWVLMGSNSIGYILPVLPRAIDFSDDGITWRAGYGPRLTNFSSAGINQLDYCLSALRKDTYSRQAVLSILNPLEDMAVEKTKDFPCSNHLQFLVRPNGSEYQLQSRLVIRSNDLVWGASAINIIEFTVIQELMAGFLGVGLGPYWHTPGSLHIYPKNLKFDPDALCSKHSGEDSSFLRFSQEYFEYPQDDRHYRELQTFQALEAPLFRFFQRWIKKTPLNKEKDGGDEIHEIRDYLPGVIADLCFAAWAFWEEDPKNGQWIKLIRDPNLVRSLQMSWIPSKKK